MAATRKNREKRKKSELKKVNLKNNAKCSKITRKTHVLVNRSRKTKQNKVKRKNYSSESVENALKALDTGISIRKAAAAYGIPVATLARRKNHPVEFKTKPGPDTVLSKAIEQDIVNWILYKAERGQPVNKNELLDSVQFYVKMKGIATPFLHNRPGRHWFEGFKKRHSSTSIRKPQHLSVSRASVTREDLQEWFDEQEKYLKKNNLLHICPSRIFNCDESSILICPDSDKVLTTKDTRAVYKVADGGKECLTVLFMYSADGTRAPPMLMFAYKEGVPKNIAEKTPRNWGIDISDTGWMNAETFYEYITNVFYPWLIEEKVQFPVIIYLDNHSSHITVPLVGFCRDNQIELIGLYPNCTHVMQPLDIALFHPFKESWKKTVAKWKMQNNVMKLKKEDFPAVLKMAMHNMLKEKEAIVSGFRASGLAPFNPSAVVYDIFQKRKKNLNLVQEQQDLGNLPEDSTQHLRKFENNLSAELLQEFKDASLTGQWTGDVEKKALYEYWFQIRDTSTGNIQKLTINSVKTLVNHKINLVRQESGNENFPSNDSLVNENDLQIVTQEVSANRNESLIEVVLINNTLELEENILLESSDINIEFQLDEHIMSNNQAESNLGSRLTTTDFEEVCNSSSEGNIEVNKENNNMIANKGADINPDECFAKAFTLPIEYLPKKKKMKVEGSGKPKLPAAGTADEWWKYYTI